MTVGAALQADGLITFRGTQAKLPLEIWQRKIKRDQEIIFFFLMQSGAHVVYVFFLYFVPYISTLSSNKQHRAQTPLSSIWNKKSAPRARHEKKPIQNRAGHKSLAHVDRDRRLLGAEQQHRQTGGMPTQTVSDKKPNFGEEHCTAHWNWPWKAAPCCLNVFSEFTPFN